MTYDPRKGQSPYLGMDVDDYPDEDRIDTIRQDSEMSRRREVGASDLGGTRVSPAAHNNRSVPQTVRRSSVPPRRGMAPAQIRSTPYYGQRIVRPASASSAQVPRAVPSPPQQRDVPVAQGSSRGSKALMLLGSILLRLLALCLRLAAIALAFAVLASALLTDSRRAILVQALNLTSWLVPSSIVGRFVMETPFGGALRGDLIIASIVLFVADWLCLVYAVRLGNMRERGL